MGASQSVFTEQELEDYQVGKEGVIESDSSSKLLTHCSVCCMGDWEGV